MPSLGRRLRQQLQVSLGELLAPAQDPRQAYADPHQRQVALLDDVRRAAADIARAKGRLTGLIAELRVTSTTLDEDARSALIAGRDDLALLIVRRRQLAQRELQTLARHVEDVAHEEQRLNLVEHRLTVQLEAFNLRRETIAARSSAVEAQVRIQEELSGLSGDFGDLGVALERAEATAERLEARAAAIDQLVASGMLGSLGMPSDNGAERDLGGRDVDDHLAALRRQLGLEPAADDEP